MDKNMNIQQQKFKVIIFEIKKAFLSDIQHALNLSLCHVYKVVDAEQKADSVLNLITDIVLKHATLGDKTKIETPSLYVELAKIKANNLPTNITVNNGVFKVPPFCNLVNENASSTNLINKPGDENSCVNRVINIKVRRLFILSIYLSNIYY